MAYKLNMTPDQIADRIGKAFGGTIQDENRAVIRLLPTGENPADDVDDNLVPVEHGSERVVVNAIYKRSVFPEGITPLHDGLPVLVKQRNGKLIIFDEDPERAPAFWADLPPAAFAPPKGLVPTEDIYDDAITTAKLADEAVTVDKLNIIPPEDTTYFEFQQPRLVIDTGGTGELSTLKDAIGDSVHPTVTDDETEGYRYGSNWEVSGGAYHLFYELFSPATGAAVWYAKNPKHNTTTTNPTVTSDIDALYVAFRSMWYNSTTDQLWRCISHAPGAAVWVQVNGYGGNAETAAKVVATPPTSTGAAALVTLGKEHIQTAATAARLLQNIFTQTANVTVDATVTTAATTLTGSGIGSITIPANRLAVGTSIEFYASGYFTRTSNSCDFILKLGGVTLQTIAPVFDANATNAGWSARGSITCRTTGGSGTVVSHFDTLRITNPKTIGTVTTSSTVDTTGTLDVDLQADWATNAASNTIVCQQFTINIIG